MVSSSVPWRTVYSLSAVKSAHRLMITVAVTAFFLALLGLLLSSSVTYWVLLGFFVAYGMFKAYKRMTVYMQTSEHGVTVNKGRKSNEIAWGEIENILVTCSPAAVNLGNGVMLPPRETWERRLREDSTLILADPEAGPVKIHDILIIRRSNPGVPVKVEPTDREAWSALSEGFWWNRENFDRPLNL